MAGLGCPICAALGQGDNDFWVEVFTGRSAEVYLERRTRLPAIASWCGGSATSRNRTISAPGNGLVIEVAHHFGIDDDRLSELGW